MNAEQLKIKFEVYLLTERRVSHNTFHSYKRDLEQFIIFLQKNSLFIESMTSEDLKKFIHYLHGLKLASKSISRKISTLKAFFSYLNLHHGIANITTTIYFPKIEKKLPSYLNQEEIKNLFFYAEQDQSLLGKRNALMLYLLYVSGMRVSELTHIQTTDIHFDTQMITIHGKGGKQRIIPLPETILNMVREYIKTVQADFSSDKHDSSYIFPVIYGKKIKPISRQSCWIILKKLCLEAGIKKAISPHQLRHSFATHMLQQGADLRSLQILLGHEDIATVQVYTHIETSHLRILYDKKHPRS